MINFFEKDNFLTDIELLNIDYLCVKANTYNSKTGKTLLLYQLKDKIPESIKIKLKKIIGEFDIVRSQVYELEEPYRIHNDSGKDNNSVYTCIIPLDLQPKGGVIVFDQWAENFSYSLDDYYHNKESYNKLLKLNDREKIIQNFNKNLRLPDTNDFKHIKCQDKIGFSIQKKFEFSFNKLVIFQSKFFHCSQNVVDFDNKRSLVIFTK